MKKLILLLFIPLISFGQEQNIDDSYYDKHISLKFWTVDGVERNALVYIPEKAVSYTHLTLPTTPYV